MALSKAVKFRIRKNKTKHMTMAWKRPINAMVWFLNGYFKSIGNGSHGKLGKTSPIDKVIQPFVQSLTKRQAVIIRWHETKHHSKAKDTMEFLKNIQKEPIHS